MDRNTLLGTALALAGIAGYGAGIAVAVPGRSVSIIAVMVGITLAAIPHESTVGAEA